MNYFFETSKVQKKALKTIGVFMPLIENLTAKVAQTTNFTNNNNKHF